MKIRKTIKLFVAGFLLLSSCVYAIDPPSLELPVDGHEHIKLSGQKFDWSDVNGATSYRIVVADNSTFSGFNDTGDSNTNCNQRCKTEHTTLSEFSGFSGLKENVRYYWKVRSNASGWSNVYSFTPKYGAVRVTINPTELRDRAKFQVITDFGGVGWENSGKIVSQLNYESVQIEFSSIDGWNKPKNQTVKIVKGQIESVSGTYEKSVAGIPDLIIDAISLTRSKVTENETFDITTNVKNIGSGASAASTLRLYRSNDAIINSSDTQLNARTVSSLSENGNQNLSYSGNISLAGTYYIGACVDPVVGESSTTNNCSEGKEIAVTKKNQQINGACGTANNHQFSYSESAYGTYKQCSSGTSNNTKFPEEGKSVTWSCIGENRGSSSDCSASRATNPNSQSQPPVLKNIKNLDSCLTDKTKKCVKVNQTATLKFDITDINNNISKLQVDWDGDGKPEYSENFSGGQASAEASYKFSSNDIQGCPNNTIFRNDGICWKKNVTLTATAYDDNGNASNVFSQAFVLYDDVGYQKAVTDLKSAEEERKRLNDQIKAEQLNQQQAAANESGLQLQCSAKQNIDGWEKYSELKQYDAFREFDGALEYCRKAKEIVIKCSDADKAQCNERSYFTNSFNYEIKITFPDAPFCLNSNNKSINYPAEIVSWYIADGNRILFERKTVVNLQQKSEYIKSVTYKLKNKLSSLSNEYALKCNLDDLLELTENEWADRVKSSEKFDEVVSGYAKNKSITKEQAAEAIAKGSARALSEIVNEYKELPSNTKNTVDTSLSVALQFITAPQSTVNNLKGEANKYGAAVAQIAEEMVEVIPDLPESIKHISPYDQIFFTAYVSTHIAHELAPTSKLKLLKLKAPNRPDWLEKSLISVRLQKTAKDSNVLVYVSYNPSHGKIQYVGITQDIKRRGKQHLDEKDIRISQIPNLKNLSREDAKACEQFLIDFYGLGKRNQAEGQLYWNMINSISKTNPNYPDATVRGKKLLDDSGFDYKKHLLIK